ncbi:MAG TPA: hypothetical protein VF519_13225 [Mycobacteriales bacterium]
MTDLPRRSYPLVVPPPGGFEDAVRRGRGVRRRRAGGASGAALVLVGALGYAVLGGPNGVDRVVPTDERQDERSYQPPSGGLVPTATPKPSASSGPRTGALPTQGTGAVTGVRPTAGPTAIPTVRPTRDGSSGGQSRAFARRPEIVRDPEAETNTDTGCLSSPDEWCVRASVDDTSPESGYTFTYLLCRHVNAGPGEITFDWTQEIEFTATDVARNDTVFTYSRGVRRTGDEETVTVQPNTCQRWHMLWNGFDDYGLTPPPGEYRMVARPLSRETLPAAEATFQHD